MSPRYLVAAALAALLSVPVSAQSVKAGIEAWQHADYSNAVAIWRPLAARGDADAQFNLGQAYRLGRGVPLDLRAAKMWFERAAIAGHLDAETTLGLLLFQNGEEEVGLKWLRQAADKGEPRALLVYGTALYNGDGVSKDRLLGYAYVSRAASQGLAPAKETLAQLDSLMGESDRKKALQMAQAATNSDSSSKPDESTRVAPSNRSTPTATETKKRAPKPSNAKMAARKTAERPGSAPARYGNWRIQLGAFSKRSSAEALYRRLGGKAALAGRSAIYLSAGTVTRLQVGPFQTRAAATSACAQLGTACFAVPAK